MIGSKLFCFLLSIEFDCLGFFVMVRLRPLLAVALVGVSFGGARGAGVRPAHPRQTFVSVPGSQIFRARNLEAEQDPSPAPTDHPSTEHPATEGQTDEGAGTGGEVEEGGEKKEGKKKESVDKHENEKLSEEERKKVLEKKDGLQIEMEKDGSLDSPRRKEDLKFREQLKKLGLVKTLRSLGQSGQSVQSRALDAESFSSIFSPKAEGIVKALPRCLIQPPLAPSFKLLQHLVDDVSQNKFNATEAAAQGIDEKVLPCLLRPGGCESEYKAPTETKKDSHSGNELKKTQAMIEKAVSKLQQDLDMRTAEVVKEIERRAAEMRRRISQEADSIIEAIKFLVLQLADSVTRADEMGEGFVREWFDEAQGKYVGMTPAESKPLDDNIHQWDADLKKQNQDGHKEMQEHLKEAVKKTREKYGEPKSDAGLTLEQQLGIGKLEPEKEKVKEPEPSSKPESKGEQKPDAKSKKEKTSEKGATPAPTTTPTTYAADTTIAPTTVASTTTTTVPATSTTITTKTTSMSSSASTSVSPTQKSSGGESGEGKKGEGKDGKQEENGAPSANSGDPSKWTPAHDTHPQTEPAGGEKQLQGLEQPYGFIDI